MHLPILFQATILGSPAAAGEMAGILGWGWFLISLLVILVVAVLLIYNATQSDKSPYLEHLAHQDTHDDHSSHAEHSRAAMLPSIHESAHEEVSFAVSAVDAPAEAVLPDNLEIIEGIGPKIAALLQRSGIQTLSQLAATDVAVLHQILHDAGLRVNDPTTWPEQARLAAQGNWEAFEALTAQLKGGRRV